ncbi:AGE family epimerase/isomerase [Sinisalibacter aestuarii]|uniref:Mannose-6-phosphate isomerase n=1 Tax=Sinisalibacter aestuarii TaxID=2949426 RepID=A0ABQ5LV01_9RHOB|nr:AGE family epimerase/isomerase [Sinisalibacter aestuarii]GKY88816.1 mannose-6-phosphate isomerase [Sinisalibacter aestuarii]
MPQPLPARPLHRRWLIGQAERLVGFHRASLGGPAGFRMLGQDGQPLHGADEVFQIHDSTRMVHVLSLATQLGIPGLADGIDQGMRFLWSHHRDARRGGYVWGVTADGPARDDKLAYGHAFVLLAAASALRVGHPQAQTLLDDVSEVIEARFWDAEHGAMREEFRADWSGTGPYRGQNSNMHMTEALMAAFEATGARSYLDKALSIADLIVNRTARAQGWRVAEHFDSTWQVDLAYEGDPMFRPAGITPGHALEWARLLVQLHDLSGQAHGWMIEAAKGLFAEATAHGWDTARGGFIYTLGWDNAPLQSLRLWWPNAEAIGAAATLWKHDGDALALDWYAKVWDVVAGHFIDHTHGGWFPELDDKNRPTGAIFAGKPDIYHAFQACIVPLLPPGTHISGDLTAVTL